MSDNLIGHKAVLSLAGARRVLAAAEAEAIRQGWPVVIAVVDDGGHPLCLARLDGAQHGSVEVALAKARAAVAFKRPTRAWSEALGGGRLNVLGLPGVLPAEGGLPILHQGQIVGAIGVSGVQPHEDGQVAQAGSAVNLA
ncbi:MAG: heme-binding protein [Pseudomonadota bacterium]